MNKKAFRQIEDSDMISEEIKKWERQKHLELINKRSKQTTAHQNEGKSECVNSGAQVDSESKKHVSYFLFFPLYFDIQAKISCAISRKHIRKGTQQ